MSDRPIPDLILDVGAPAQGGSCVARADDGRVVFVRHALPGERVRASVTDDAGSYLRADAVEVLTASPDRVPAPCPHAGPGRCGGCDFQHASGAAQRALKAAVVREQFHRLAGLDVDLDTVEELPGGLLGWRTRVAFAVGRAGDGNHDCDGATMGLRRHRSHAIERVGSCPLGVPAVASAPTEAPPKATAVERAVGDETGGEPAVLARRPGPGRQARGRRPPDRIELLAGPRRLRHRLPDRLGGAELEVAADGFWQVHPHALASFAEALIDGVAPMPGETALDLYAGAGPLTAALAHAVGPTGRVIGVESAGQAVADATANLAGAPWAEVRRGRVDAASVGAFADGPADERPDLVVLDPPRAGAGAATMRAVLALRPTRIGYLSCDPATLARDVRAAVDAGWALRFLRAFDAFPMTQHVECLAVLGPATP